MCVDRLQEEFHLVCEAGLFEYALALGNVLCDLAEKVRGASEVQTDAQRTEGSWVPMGMRQKSTGSVRIAVGGGSVRTGDGVEVGHDEL